MTIKYGLQSFFFELTDNDGQKFLAGIVCTTLLQTHPLTVNWRQILNAPSHVSIGGFIPAARRSSQVNSYS
jgi:hypothetical protein